MTQDQKQYLDLLKDHESEETKYDCLQIGMELGWSETKTDSIIKQLLKKGDLEERSIGIRSYGTPKY